MAAPTAQEKPLIPRCRRCSRAAECCPERTPPDVETLEEWMDGGGCETPSGEWVEADGRGEGGCPSWMLILGVI